MSFSLKNQVKRSLPSFSAYVLQPLWQGCRRALNRMVFVLRHPEVHVVECRKPRYGQFNQPALIDYLLDGKENGFFLDIGANHPFLNNNTVFFERERRYTGFAFDPLSKYAELWALERPRSVFIPTALGRASGEISFFEHENDDGWADQLSYTGSSSLALDGATSKLVRMERLDEIPNLPRDIDFASVDVEGAELDVLTGFGDQVRPRILLVENCFGVSGSEDVRRRVTEMGYTQVARVSYIDDVYVANDEIEIMERSHHIRSALHEYFL